MEHQKSTATVEPTELSTSGKIIQKEGVPISSVAVNPEVRPSMPSVVPVAECRRSSRKKIIKFDVRDLLNKHRKPHKIQIEARIDSNAPSTSKACSASTVGETISLSMVSNKVGSQDLSSKQKAFMEKSAFFRRFSVSQDQTKPMPPPPIPLPPTIHGDEKDTALNVSGKRLNRSQEYYKNALLKPKQTTSLIVAQVESNSRFLEFTNQSNVDDKVDGPVQESREAPQPRRRGRPPKIRTNDIGKTSTVINNTIKETNKLSPEKAKNWKEYKACLAEQHNTAIEKPVVVDIPETVKKDNLSLRSAVVGSKKTAVNLSSMLDKEKESNLKSIRDLGTRTEKDPTLNITEVLTDYTIFTNTDRDLSSIVTKEKTQHSDTTKGVIELCLEENLKEKIRDKKNEEFSETKETLVPQNNDIPRENILLGTKETHDSIIDMPHSVGSTEKENPKLVEKIKRSERLKFKIEDENVKQDFPLNISSSNRRRIKPTKSCEYSSHEDDEKSSETSTENFSSDSISTVETTDSKSSALKDQKIQSIDSHEPCVSKHERIKHNQQRKSLRKRKELNKELEPNLSNSTVLQKLPSASVDIETNKNEGQEKLLTNILNKEDKTEFKEKLHEPVITTQDISNEMTFSASSSIRIENNQTNAKQIALQATRKSLRKHKDVIPISSDPVPDKKLLCEHENTSRNVKTTSTNVLTLKSKCENDEQNKSNTDSNEIKVNAKQHMKNKKDSDCIAETEEGNLISLWAAASNSEEKMDVKKNRNESENQNQKAKNQIAVAEIFQGSENPLTILQKAIEQTMASDETKVQHTEGSENSLTILQKAIEQTMASDETKVQHTEGSENPLTILQKAIEQTMASDETKVQHTEGSENPLNILQKAIEQTMASDETKVQHTEGFENPLNILQKAIEQTMASDETKVQNTQGSENPLNILQKAIEQTMASDETKVQHTEVDQQKSVSSQNVEVVVTSAMSNIIETKLENLQQKETNIISQINEEKNEVYGKISDISKEFCTENINISDQAVVHCPELEESNVEDVILPAPPRDTILQPVTVEQSSILVEEHSSNEENSPLSCSQQDFGVLKNINAVEDAKIPIRKATNKIQDSPTTSMSTTLLCPKTKNKNKDLPSIHNKFEEPPNPMLTKDDLVSEPTQTLKEQKNLQTKTDNVIPFKKQKSDSGYCEVESSKDRKIKDAQNSEIGLIEVSSYIAVNEGNNTNLPKRLSLRKQKEKVGVTNDKQNNIKKALPQEKPEVKETAMKLSTDIDTKEKMDALSTCISAENESTILDAVTKEKLVDNEESGLIGALTAVTQSSHTSSDMSSVKKKKTRNNRIKKLHLPDSDADNKPQNSDEHQSVISDSPKNSNDSENNLKDLVFAPVKDESSCFEQQETMIDVSSNSVDAKKGHIESSIVLNEESKYCNEEKKIITDMPIDLPSDAKKDLKESSSSFVIEELKSSLHVNQTPMDEVSDILMSQSQESSKMTDVSSNQTESYVIQNVSIETNTLLDILRTVQCNEEAAGVVQKISSSVEEKQNSEASSDACSTKNVMSVKKLNDSKSNSPCRSNSGSPFNQKKRTGSPYLSETAPLSPSTLRKCNSSPHSDTLSPLLSLNKKITRRYDRISRRGDNDTPHKTLEETFAEIAALSSKAVLDMTTKEGDEELLATSNISAITKESQLEVCDNSALEEINTIEDINHSVGNQNVQTIEETVTCSTPVSMEILDTNYMTEKTALEQQESIEEAAVSTSHLKIENIELKEFEASNETNNSITLITDKNINDQSQLQEENNSYENKSSCTLETEIITLEIKQLEQVSQNVASLAEQEIDKEDIRPAQISNEEPTTPKSSPRKKWSTSSCKSENEAVKTKSPKIMKTAEDDPNNTPKTPTSKRGRKPKTMSGDKTPSPVANSSGKKDNKEKNTNSEEKKKEQAETNNEIFGDKLSKKSRKRKLKEEFEAALTERGRNEEETTTTIEETCFETPSSSPTVESIRNISNSPFDADSQKMSDYALPHNNNPPIPEEPEEDPDPLKDIEKFIEDGVNLLKKGYKIDEDSVDNVIIANTKEAEASQSTDSSFGITNMELVAQSFETPADTPINTPSGTPPPISPESAFLTEEYSLGGVRRSHRIKLITQTPKALVGRGLVKDKERFSIKDDVETKSHYTLDDHLLDLAEVEAKNAKFLKEMEERLSNFQVIKENEYQCERVVSREARKMICDCFLTAEEEVRGELGCGEDCLNRLLMIECGPDCNVRERCTNKRFQRFLCSPCRVFRTEKKGFGIMADIEILPGEFIMEYVGEVIDTEEFERRRIAYSQEKNRHYYFMALRSDAIIDATIKGNISRFINHSCDPNAETQKWTVNGELRIGFFSRKSIMPGEEITFNYQYQRYGREAQRCYCESSNCRGWIGQEPTSDEGEQIDDDDDETDDEEEEDNTNLLEDDDDSDASVSDPEEAQKRLEMAAAAAELAPIAIEEKTKDSEISGKENETEVAIKQISDEEDSKSKFKKLLSKMAEKVAAKQKQTKKEQKLQRKKKSKETSSSEQHNKLRSLEDPDIEDEVEFLSRCGLKNQSDTLRLSRLMVRAKLVQTRLNLLAILRKGELPCRRLFLDYHGLRLVHGWMSEDAGNMEIRLALLHTLELLPIANKTVLNDSKVIQVVKSWCGSAKETLSPNDDSQSSNSNSHDAANVQPDNENVNSDISELQKLASKLASTWDGLPEIFRIPKKERIEQMKEHEREADRQYAETEENNRPASTDRFSKRFNTIKRFGKPCGSKQIVSTTTTTCNTLMRSNAGSTCSENLSSISKEQRRELFAASVAKHEAEKRLAEERREFEIKCRFFGLDQKKTRPQDIPFCVNPATGQWYSIERKPILTPPSHALVQIPERQKSTDPADYQLPDICSTLPPHWRYAITPKGQIYYYHVQYRIPQWEQPSASQLNESELNLEDYESENEETPTTSKDSSDDDDDDKFMVGMDTAQLKEYIDRKVEARRQKRYQRLVDERPISPRREEDRIYNQVEVRKYKENKEKIRKRKEEIRRKRAEALRQSCILGSLTTTENNTNPVKLEIEDSAVMGALPIQDYLLSSDEDEDIKIEVNSPLIDKIVEGDKIVDELDALTTKRKLKRPLPPHRDLSESLSNTSTASTAASVTSSLTSTDKLEYKKRKMEKKDKRKNKDQDAKYRKAKEKFRCEIAGIIVHHLKSYRKDTCKRGRIESNDDFNHLARKLTHFVMIKELKYCESVGQTLVVTESVKNKSREFIKKYMTKYGKLYVKPSNDPEFKDIPFHL